MALELKELRKRFAEVMEESPKLQKPLRAILDGKASYITAEEYAYEVGSALAEVFSEAFSSETLPGGVMTKALAEELIRPLLYDDYNLINAATMQVQTVLNEAAGLHIMAQSAAINTSKVDGLIDKVSAAENYDDVAWVLQEPVRNFSQSVVSDVMKANVEFHGRAGLRARIVRKAEARCCKWCSNLAGVYEYPMVPDDVYRRHERCRCSVEYTPGGTRYQNVHSKQWRTATESEKKNELKTFGLNK